MIAVDTNILIYAHRQEMPAHEAAAIQLKRLAEGDALWGLPVFCLAEFMRVVTHPRVFKPATELPVALAVLDQLLTSPMVRLLSPGPRYPRLFRRAVEVANARGNLAFDAQIAAVCEENGATRLLSADRDFARFPAIELVAL